MFPIVDLRYVFGRFKTEKLPSPLAFVACESKSNLTIFPTSLIKKLLFHEISCKNQKNIYETQTSFYHLDSQKIYMEK